MIESIKHRGLRRAHVRGDFRGVHATHAKRIAAILSDLDAASAVSDLDLPTYRLHRLKGSLEGLWSIRVSRNWRIVFRFEDGDAHNVDLVDYH